MDVHKTLYPFYTPTKMLHVTESVREQFASLAAIARYIVISAVDSPKIWEGKCLILGE